MTSTRSTGYMGELIAAKYLETKGHCILKKNWYCRYGEIDLVTAIKGLLVFVEVKFLKSSVYCSPVELFSFRKRQHVYKSVRYFLYQYPKYSSSWRFDLLCLTLDTGRVWVEHYKNAFSFNDG